MTHSVLFLFSVCFFWCVCVCVCVCVYICMCVCVCGNLTIHSYPHQHIARFHSCRVTLQLYIDLQLRSVSYCQDEPHNNNLFSFIAQESPTSPMMCHVFKSDNQGNEIMAAIGLCFSKGAVNTKNMVCVCGWVCVCVGVCVLCFSC